MDEEIKPIPFAKEIDTPATDTTMVTKSTTTSATFEQDLKQFQDTDAIDMSKCSDNIGETQYRKPAVNWLPEEDEELTRLAHEYKFRNWQLISNEISHKFQKKQIRSCN